ncbi:MAG TPA: EAL domain-containing response regulator, partial [Gammaproteobacteria bacterium]|nr:EAL domain-containing response regulator [Gammaproteobacteria bacterium]
MSNQRLLILDDDASVGRTVEYMAESLGLEPQAVSSPETFFEQVGRWKPHYILLDMLMPRMDGVQIIERLGETGCTASIIIFSGVDARTREAAQRTAMEHHLDVAGTLGKPFRTAELRGIIDRARQDGKRGPTNPQTRPDTMVDEADLERAVREREFEVVYQPKVRCTTGALVGFEALVRWRHPELGLIMPDRFIPLSEATGLIDPLTSLVVEQAVDWIMGLQVDGDPPALAINISARNLTNADCTDRLDEFCRGAGFDPARLTLELTETAAMDDAAQALGMMTRLRMKGFHLSIDDFGTGYSSMLQLSRMPFSEIKIDQSFVM